MKKSLLAFALVGAALASTAAHASTHAPAFYGSAGVTQSHLSVGDVGGFDRSATGATIALGASFNKNFAVEASYTDFGKRTAQTNYGNVDVDTSALGLHVVAKYPVTENVSVYVKPGLLQTKIDILGASAHNTRASVGFGVTHAVTSNVAIKTEFNHIRDVAGTGLNANAVTVGVQVGF